MSYIPRVEIPMFILFFNLMTTGPLMYNLMVTRTCNTLLGYNISECEQLGGGTSDDHLKKMESESQSINSIISITNSMTESVLTVLVSFLIGPWSDKFGRRPAFLICTTALFISGILTIIFTYFDNLSSWYSLINGLPAMFCGGIYSFVGVANSYISETTDENERSFALGYFTISILAGQVFGTLLSTYLLEWVGYVGTFCILQYLLGFSVAFTCFFIPESLKDIKKEGRLQGFFDMSNIKEMYITIVRKREKNYRSLILLFTLINAFATFTTAGEMATLNGFLRVKFGWSQSHYTKFFAAQNCLSMVGTMLGVFLFQKWLKLRPIIATTICLSLMLVGSLLMANAHLDWHVYLVPIIRIMDSSTGPFAVARISLITDANERGKVLSAMMSTRFLFTLVSAPLYSFVYKSTLDTDAAIYNYISSGAFAIAIVIALITILVENRYSETETTDKDKKKESIN